MYLLDVSIRDLKYFCVLFVLFVFLFMLLASLRCYTSIYDGFISSLGLVEEVDKGPNVPKHHLEGLFHLRPPAVGVVKGSPGVNER